MTDASKKHLGICLSDIAKRACPFIEGLLFV
jgi:hypothetical protein